MHLLEPSTLAWVDDDYIIIDFPYAKACVLRNKTSIISNERK